MINYLMKGNLAPRAWYTLRNTTLKSLWHWVFHHLPQMFSSHYACLSCLYPLSLHWRLSVSPSQSTHINIQTLEHQMIRYSILTVFYVFCVCCNSVLCVYKSAYEFTWPWDRESHGPGTYLVANNSCDPSVSSPHRYALFIWVLYLTSNTKLMQQALFPTETFSQIHAAYFSSWFGFYFIHLCIT